MGIQRSQATVIGGGMVGSAMALALADEGIEVILVEASPDQRGQLPATPDLRVSAVNLASEQLLTALGIWPRLPAQRLCPYRQLAVWEQGGPDVMFDANQTDETHLGHILENDCLRAAAWEAMRQHPRISLRAPEQLTSLIQQDEAVLLQLASGEEFETELVVAADGARSQVRALAGIGTTAWDYAQHALVVNVAIESPQQAITWQEFVPTGPRAFLPLWGQHASLVWYHQAEMVKALRQLPESQLHSAIESAFPERLPPFQIQQVGSFPLTRQHANQYVAGRVVLVGDAAHQINPLAGQGVNLGFKDVDCLAQVLKDHDTSDWPAQLRRYQQIRRPRNLLMMSAMDGLYASFSNDIAAVKLLRNAGLWMAEHAGPFKTQALKYAMGLID